MLIPSDAVGVLPLLLKVSLYAAMERNCGFAEPRDLVKAIYIVDLEHVSEFWNNWQDFERLVSDEKLANAISGVYINRLLYLLRLEIMNREGEGLFVLGRVSQALQEVVATARDIASERAGAMSTPSSRDILFSICSRDSELSAILQESGLQLGKLAAAVGRSGV